MQQFSIEILSMKGFNTPERKQKLLAAITLVERRVNSEEFKTWFYEQQFTQLGDLEEKSKDDLFSMVMRKASFNYYLTPRPWYKRLSSVLGWEEDPTHVYCYANSYDGFSVADTGDNLFHEGLHCLGFSHSYRWVPERDFSLPYSCGHYILKNR